MRQKWASRSVLIMAAAFVLACVGFAWVVDHPPRAAPVPAASLGQPPDPGAELFAVRCQRCHDRDEAWELLQQDSDRAAQWLRLDRHRKAETAENGLILDHLRLREGTKTGGHEGT